MVRTIGLGTGFVALPIEGSQRGGAFEFEVAFSKMARFDGEMKAQHRRPQITRLSDGLVDLQVILVGLQRRTKGTNPLNETAPLACIIRPFQRRSSSTNPAGSSSKSLMNGSWPISKNQWLTSSPLMYQLKLAAGEERSDLHVMLTTSPME